MERIVKKEHVGKFGKLSAGAKGFEKTIYGSVFFVDNEDIGHRFPVNQVSAFEEQEFKDKTK
jgi:hypothetical protein